jgi:hypothetical protein
MTPYETVHTQWKRCESAVEVWYGSEAKGSAPKGTGPLFLLEPAVTTYTVALPSVLQLTHARMAPTPVTH